jgi:hypothetical protein
VPKKTLAINSGEEKEKFVKKKFETKEIIKGGERKRRKIFGEKNMWRQKVGGIF